MKIYNQIRCIFSKFNSARIWRKTQTEF